MIKYVNFCSLFDLFSIGFEFISRQTLNMYKIQLVRLKITGEKISKEFSVNSGLVLSKMGKLWS